MLKTIIQQLIKQYDTHDPFEIARQLGIIVLEEPLGSVNGYYSKTHRQKMIHLNNNLSDFRRQFTCAHELAHAILHPDANTPFLRENTLFSVNKFEIEANRFAVQLLYPDDALQDLLEWPIGQAANYMGVPTWLAEYRMRSVEPKFMV